ncbi:MAG: twin-arginine translocase TatA/TatE family subunit [Bacteroidales bacterium]|nr:twin-arginine translocase TatA/TatE family subunit [Bacteroidales bacterium]MDE6516197.1 twin-arginine translocase TatA/TatE family subunit [Bacteroidales bacterium]MDE7090975.1 twin-arginine translocase TatA/TatE family subunit [Bacteroidales bacterium]MDE7102960.1 twin-arginine translocase TatA/TatE family subunit [Bacteroidales bacterium]
MNLLLTPLFMGLGGQEILIIAIIVLLLFGGRKIPELMKGLGKGIKSFKEGMNGTETESDKQEKKEASDKTEA